MIDPTTGNPFAAQVPSQWQPYIPILVGFARDAVKVAGTAGFTWALTVNDSYIQMGVSVAMILAGSASSAWQKIKAWRALRQAAAQPAGLTAPKLPS